MDEINLSYILAWKCAQWMVFSIQFIHISKKKTDCTSSLISSTWVKEELHNSESPIYELLEIIIFVSQQFHPGLNPAPAPW